MKGRVGSVGSLVIVLNQMRRKKRRNIEKGNRKEKKERVKKNVRLEVNRSERDENKIE